jgi:hypothetical protein
MGDAALAYQKMLKDLQYRVYTDGNKKLKDFGFPEPDKCDTELQRERIVFKAPQQQQLFEKLSSKGNLITYIFMFYIYFK